ncbi:MAG TPA: serine/threonine-protein kinase [Candidatus Didemnitutus sp.]|nr:serine/threonine-protein kinase [Candidatus Didemnitutus sp.]
MTDSREREEAIFAEALALPTLDRPRFIAEACGGDAVLRERVEGLLRAHDSAGEFMEVAPVAAAEPASPAGTPLPAEMPGLRIGRYKLLQKIGEGGCGVVWMAEQQEPVRRRVAIKIIKLGMDTREVVARFEAERQALAIMDHPNIARVLDAGATDSGRPFFVMELVRGVPITRYCDENQLTPTDRLELFIKVCSAVQHAHHKGIIHRDLKPSNILVTAHDGEAVPKVIDFGIAKATQGRLTNQTLFTALEQFIGTPAYMSPEQAELSGLDIDTRSDIYSLGVLLYELLAGRPPFDPQSLVRIGLDEVRRIIREVEPPKPSTNLSTLNDVDRLTIARMRGTDPAGLSVLLRGDLDWIVMKAMEKNRTRRYDTPAALAADIAHYLRHEPVTASPPSRVYRLGKLLRRHRMFFAALTAIVIVLIAGTIVSSVQAIRAWRAEQHAEVERLKALREHARAEDLFGFMLGDLHDALDKVGRLEVLDQVGDKAMAYFSSLKPGEVDDARLLRHAKALRQIGEIRMAQARYNDAAAAFNEAYARASALASRHPRDGDILFERGQTEFWVGLVSRKRGDLAATTEWFARYYATAQALAQLDPAKLEWQSELVYGQDNVAVARLDRGELEEARQDFLRELATVERLAQLTPGDTRWRARMANLHSWLGELADRLGEYAEALRQYMIETELFGALAQAEPKTPVWRYQLADSLQFQTGVLLVTGQLAAAENRAREARQLIDEVTAADPANRRWRAVALQCRLQEVRVLRARGSPLAALALLDEARPKIEALAASEPSDRSFMLRTVATWRMTAQLRAGLGRHDAGSAAEQAAALADKLLRDRTVSTAILGECATVYVIAGEFAALSGDSETSQRHWQRAVDLLSPRLKGSRDWRLLDPAARTFAHMGRTTEAQTAISNLHLLGYVPLDPWPDDIGLDPAKFTVPTTQPK